MGLRRLERGERATESHSQLVLAISLTTPTSSSRPGRRYAGKHGDLAAAVKIQSVYRGHVCRSSYLRYTGAEVAARLIQKKWNSYHSHRMTLQKLMGVREKNQQRWEEMQHAFCANWEKIKTRPRMVVHIPSISVDEQKRATLSHMKTRENMQMSRLCAVADPLVDVLYVAPFNLNSDVERYYHQLLEVGLGERWVFACFASSRLVERL